MVLVLQGTPPDGIMGGYCRATLVADGGRKWGRRCGHFPDQILIDPSARNKALLKHNPLSGITG